MNRASKLAAGLVLGVASSAAVAEITACDVEITRERTRQEMACQMQYGPPSGRLPQGNWHPGYHDALDRCLDRVQAEFRVERWACQGIEFRNPLKTSPKLRGIHQQVRTLVPPTRRQRFPLGTPLRIWKSGLCRPIALCYRSGSARTAQNL